MRWVRALRRNWISDKEFRQIGAATLVVATGLARLNGQPRAALRHARSAVERADHQDPNRYSITAECALIESAVATDDLEAASAYVEIVSGHRNIEIGELRCDMHHALSAYYRAWLQSAHSRDLGDPNQDRSGVTLQLETAELGARSEARYLDERLGTTHHLRELSKGLRPVG